MGPKASAAPADTIHPLESVYFASLILVSLQQEFLKPATDASPTQPPLPTLGAAAHSVSTTGKFANNLATCLNRGRKSLQHRVLAVVPGPVMREQLNALLFTECVLALITLNFATESLIAVLQPRQITPQIYPRRTRLCRTHLRASDPFSSPRTHGRHRKSRQRVAPWKRASPFDVIFPKRMT